MKKQLLFLMALFWSAWSFGQNVTTFTGAGNTGSTDATGTAASFSGLQDVDIDASGNLYVADSGNNKIRKITAGGVVTTFAGSGT
jgi:hypothetical protein